MLSGPVISNIGSSVKLTCIAEGHPTPSLEWYKDGELIPGETQPFLFISEVLPDDRGNYFCKATNSKGVNESGQIELTIQGNKGYHNNS